MSFCLGLDVSDKTTHLCAVGEDGTVTWRGVCATGPGTIATSGGRLIENLLDG